MSAPIVVFATNGETHVAHSAIDAKIRAAQQENILAFLKSRDKEGATNHELLELAPRFGAIIHILRNKGHRITTRATKKPRGWHYTLESA